MRLLSAFQLSRPIRRWLWGLLILGAPIAIRSEPPAAATRATDTVSELKRTLGEADSNASVRAIKALRDSDLEDPAILGLVEHLLISGPLSLRPALAMRTAQLPAGPARSALLAALVVGMDAATNANDSSKMVGVQGFGQELPRSSVVFLSATAELAQAKDLSVAELRSLTPVGSGRARECMIIVRAFKGDTSTVAELARIAQAEDPILRERAVAAFTIVGTAADLPLLKRIAETDPWGWALSPADQKVAADLAAGSYVPEPMFHPVRQAAREAVIVVQKRTEAQPGDE